MQVSVIVYAHNGASSLLNTLESLEQMSVAPDLAWEVVVVDTHSTECARQEVEAFAQQSKVNVRYLWMPQLDKALALNTGVKQAKGEIVAFTEDDVIVAPGWLMAFVKAFEQADCIGVEGRSIDAMVCPRPEPN